MYMYLYIYSCTHVYTHICMHICMYVYIHTYIYTYTYTYMYMFIYVYTYFDIYTHVCICAHMCIDIKLVYIHTCAAGVYTHIQVLIHHTTPYTHVCTYSSGIHTTSQAFVVSIHVYCVIKRHTKETYKETYKFQKTYKRALQRDVQVAKAHPRMLARYSHSLLHTHIPTPFVKPFNPTLGETLEVTFAGEKRPCVERYKRSHLHTH